jgi:arylsulfatase A-like enzyme
MLNPREKNRRGQWFYALTAMLAAFHGTFVAAADTPNVLLIVVDDLGYADLGVLGSKDMQTPHLDQLYADSVRLNQYYANCPVCSPTRAAILTGCYPDRVGVPGVIRTHAKDNWGYFAPFGKTLPGIMQEHGYDTAAIGKWHLGLRQENHPMSRGFDSFEGFLGDMMDDYYNHRRHGNNYMRSDRDEIDPKGHATDLFSDWAVDFVRTKSSRRFPKPWFLYLAYNAPHTPIQPPDDWLKKVKQREPGINPKRASLVALIEHMDAGIGRVVNTLQDAGLSENTLVIFSSDNGGQLSAGASNGPWRDGKQSVYEGGLRVPTCAVWPGQIAAGTRSRQVAVTMDLFPTICEAADAEWKQTIDGQSILPTLLGQESLDVERDIFFHRREGNLRYAGLTIQALRRGDWKLVRNSPFAPIELYNLKDDPREQRDLSKQKPKVFREMSSALRAHTQRGGAVPWQPPERRDF